MGPPADDKTWDDLATKADKKGEVGVIVALKTSANPEGDLDEGKKNTQRQKIKSKRDEVVKELKGTKFKHVAEWDEVPYTAMRVNRQALDALRRSKHVVGVEEDREIELKQDEVLSEPSGEASATASNGNNVDFWDIYRTGTDKLWANGYSGYGHTVAIVDTGVKSNHTWISGRVVREYCRAYPNGCPNGSYQQFGAGAAAPCTYHWVCAHGTHVAGTAAGYYGVADSASIIAIQVFHRSSTGVPTYNDADLTWAMKYVYDQRAALKIAAVNFSLGDNLRWTGPCSGSFESWAATLRSVGIAVVVASGNNDYRDGVNHPACSPSAISVGNTTLTCSTAPCGSTSADAVYGFTSGGSNAAYFLDLLAPGTDICNAVPSTTYECGWTGTSMAAPHVTGAFAALRQLEPWTTPTASETALAQTGSWVFDSRGNNLWKKRVEVWQAIGYASTH
jgi:subtilisin family serine protease